MRAQSGHKVATGMDKHALNRHIFSIVEPNDEEATRGSLACMHMHGIYDIHGAAASNACLDMVTRTDDYGGASTASDVNCMTNDGKKKTCSHHVSL
jgi:hypothetical protein